MTFRKTYVTANFGFSLNTRVRDKLRKLNLCFHQTRHCIDIEISDKFSLITNYRLFF